MSRTPARVTQADINRALRAAKQAGVGSVRILRDGTIEIDVQQSTEDRREIEVAVEGEVVL